MSEQQKHDLMGILRQGGLDLAADAATLRTAFNELMSRVPVADDVDHEPTTIGGVNAIDVAIRGIETVGTILYFHGGVYVIGTAAATVPLVSDLECDRHVGQRGAAGEPNRIAEQDFVRTHLDQQGW